MEEDYRKGKKGRLRLFAHRKKRKATHLITYWQERKRQRCLDETEGSSEFIENYNATPADDEGSNEITYFEMKPVCLTQNDFEHATLETIASQRSHSTTGTEMEPSCSSNVTSSHDEFTITSEDAVMDHFEVDKEPRMGSNVTSKTDAATDFLIKGYRIVEMNYFLKEITNLSNHNPSFGCSLSNMRVVKEVLNGLTPTFVFHCDMCNGEFPLHCEETKSSSRLDTNYRAVAGIMCVGGGHSHLEEFCSSLGVPCMSSKTYSKIHDKICNGWEKAALEQMEVAAKEEAALAISKGEVNENGTPLLTVVADGCWSKRSYRSQYNAASGAAAIIGYHTKKVLYMGVRNKFCYVCTRYSHTEVPIHQCYKNWSGSSAAMEASILVDGFKQSEELYGVIYSKVIADGDSSCYVRILEARPYSTTTVEKIECRNHLLRNYCTKLKNVAESSKVGEAKMRKVVASKILKMRTAVTAAIRHLQNVNQPVVEKISSLTNNILNGPRHIFGDHSKCEKYFCTGTKENETNLVPELTESGLFYEIMKAVNYLANNARSLLYNVDSNVVEQFNSIVAKFVGGKRINYSQKRSYQGRCAAAVVAHNSNKAQSVLHKTLCENASPNNYVKRLEVRRNIKNKQAEQKRSCRSTLFPSKKRNRQSTSDKDYGSNCQRPDMSPEIFLQEKKRVLDSYPQTEARRNEVEKATILQSQSGEWLELRRKMLTASNFGKVCRRQETTSCKSLVKKLMYSRDILNVPSISYGRKYETVALQQLETQENIKVGKCGLFVDDEFPFLGATPDGLLNKDGGLIEIKCPISVAGMDPEEAVRQGKLKFLVIKNNSGIDVNKKHEYYYQIQGQLRITKRKFCLLCIWTSESLNIKVIRVEKDDIFWKTCMEPFLKRFFYNCMLPELVDPRHSRNMEIRDPDYIIAAQNKMNGKKQNK